MLRDDLESRIGKSCDHVSDESGCEFRLQHLQEIRNIPEEQAYEAKILFRGPSQPQNLRPLIKIDLTFYERVLLPPLSKNIFHPYSDAFQSAVLVYPLEEILAEKLRAILQQKTRVPRPRDFYDVWTLLKGSSSRLNIQQIRTVFSEKCRFKNVSFTTHHDFFDPALLEKNRRAWRASIARQMPSVIDFDQVALELKLMLQSMFA